MKKIIAIIMVCMLCLSFCGCGNNDKIEQELEGLWTTTSSSLMVICYFENGTYLMELSNTSGELISSNSGNYTIEEERIVLSGDTNRSFEYSYENDEFKMLFGNFELTKIESEELVDYYAQKLN